MVETDPEAEEAYVPVPPPTVSDNCGEVTYVNDYNDTADASDYYPVGTTTVTWTATDEVGLTTNCSHTVTVTAAPTLHVKIELAPTVVGSLTRCIVFELWNCTAPPVMTEVAAELTFTDGVAEQDVPIPAGSYDCVVARDPLHTLSRTLTGLEPAGSLYVADFVAAGKPLLGGNLNDDGWIDILDFGHYVVLWSTLYGTGDTDCDTPAPHADINGDGLVTTIDFTFISIHFLSQAEPGCCGLYRAQSQAPVTAIPVADLEKHGLSRLRTADLNRDGWLDAQDIAAFLRGARPPQPSEVSL